MTIRRGSESRKAIPSEWSSRPMTSPTAPFGPVTGGDGGAGVSHWPLHAATCAGCRPNHEMPMASSRNGTIAVAIAAPSPSVPDRMPRW